jgi:CheY-like chemotaxis protein
MIADGTRDAGSPTAQLAVVNNRRLARVIEDSDDVRDVFATLLRLEGFAVDVARDGSEGFDEAVRSLPDIILTDLAMPVMDGWEMIRRLRQDHRTRHIPIVACSGQADRRTRDESKVDALVPKPCSFNLLLAEIRRLLVPRAA